MSATAPPPPRRRMPALVQTALMLRDPIGFLERCEELMGPIFQVNPILLPTHVYVTTPELARAVYASDGGGSEAGRVRRDFIGPIVGEHSLLSLDGPEWLRHRKLLGPAFHRRQVGGYESAIAGLAAEQLERWDTEDEFELRPRMLAITLEVILRLVFGVTDEDRLARLRVVLPQLTDAVASPLVWGVPDAAWRALARSRRLRQAPHPLRRFLRVREEVDSLLYAEIESRRAHPRDDANDVLALMLHARDDEGDAMTDVELRDELVTLLEAGHETTATALAWTFERLARHPAVLERLESDLAAGSEEYLEAVVREALRARSIVFDTPRHLTSPLELGGFEIPAGWYVTPSLPLVQRRGDGDEFRPERFLEADGGREGWIPFGGGKRHCVGSHLALLEMKVVIRETLRRYELLPTSAPPEGVKTVHVTLVPEQLARVRVRRRPEPLPARRDGQVSVGSVG